MLLAAISLCLTGCGVARSVQANNAYDASLTAYKDCLARSGAAGCEAQRLALEADKDHVAMTRAPVVIGGGGGSSYVAPRVDPVVCNTMRTGIMSSTTCN
ncbi:hypothetical protein XH92_24430 [Bradyrhizobium sp. CCBAU 53421]|nr:hypothetical protein XH92_24430 [Bradyrhizobium sp. CCBAU 53421]